MFISPPCTPLAYSEYEWKSRITHPFFPLIISLYLRYRREMYLGEEEGNLNVRIVVILPDNIIRFYLGGPIGTPSCVYLSIQD